MQKSYLICAVGRIVCVLWLPVLACTAGGGDRDSSQEVDVKLEIATGDGGFDAEHDSTEQDVSVETDEVDATLDRDNCATLVYELADRLNALANVAQECGEQAECVASEVAVPCLEPSPNKVAIGMASLDTFAGAWQDEIESFCATWPKDCNGKNQPCYFWSGLECVDQHVDRPPSCCTECSDNGCRLGTTCTTDESCIRDGYCFQFSPQSGAASHGCAYYCEETCPPGYRCVVSLNFESGNPACVPERGMLCSPCNNDDDCRLESSEGRLFSVGARCWKDDTEHRVCGAHCDADDPLAPNGFECAEYSDGIFQLRPIAGTCDASPTD